jgi:hypothetical protein
MKDSERSKIKDKAPIMKASITYFTTIFPVLYRIVRDAFVQNFVLVGHVQCLHICPHHPSSPVRIHLMIYWQSDLTHRQGRRGFSSTSRMVARTHRPR